MERRIIEFVAGLHSAGVRVSVAESEDACRAVQRLGILNRDDFRETLRATLIKRVQDEPVFEELFPVYFGHVSQLANLMEKLSPPERQLLKQAVQTLLDQLDRQEDQKHGRSQRPGDIPFDTRVENLSQMLQCLLTGQAPGQDTFEQIEQQILQAGHRPAERGRQWWFQQRMVRRLGGRLWPNIRQPLPGLLRKTGMRSHSISNLMAGLDANLEALTAQTGQYVELNLARQWAEQHADRTQKAGNLMTRSLQNLSEREANLLRSEIRRLVAQLRSRIALRQKRAKRGTPDVRKTLRHNMRYGGVPLELKFKTRPLKPRLLLLDEPLLGLSPMMQTALVDSIKTISSETGLTIVITEQFARPILPMIDRGYIIENGMLSMEGGGLELMDNPEVKAAYFGV